MGEQFGTRHPQTLCWDCARATGGCSWSEYPTQTPVEGWEAIRRDIQNRGSEDVESYIVKECPLFIRDAWQGGTIRNRE